jgi:hypothetical protein
VNKILVVLATVASLSVATSASAEVSCSRFEELATTLFRFNAKQVGLKPLISNELSAMSKGYANAYFSTNAQQTAYPGGVGHTIKYVKLQNAATTTLSKEWYDLREINHSKVLDAETAVMVDAIMLRLPVTYKQNAVVGIGFAKQSKDDVCIGVLIYKQAPKR